MKKIGSVLVLLLVSVTGVVVASEQVQEPQQHWFTEMEVGPVWQSRNDARIPGTTGTLFSIKEFGSGPFLAGRIYLGYRWTQKSEWRLLFAPLSLKGNRVLDAPISFQGTNFSAGAATESLFKFNSYRLTYRYRIVEDPEWRVWLGFTAKVRDAEIALRQSGAFANKTDLGFVPLLHFHVEYQWNSQWLIDLDGDALAAPQGRAEDVALRVNYQIAPQGRVSMGYRLLEGGADNDRVFTFTFLHYWVFGLQWAW
ncbi:hypothetical protein EBQ90_09205 [bacterium]|nr:hypothetical protein [bacterium]